MEKSPLSNSAHKSVSPLSKLSLRPELPTGDYMPQIANKSFKAEKSCIKGMSMWHLKGLEKNEIINRSCIVGFYKKIRFLKFIFIV